jgi:mannose-6-phosphate isomerase-like protein (cupin superfamily)
MTSSAFTHLLNEARKAHETHPGLSAFVGFADDLAAQPMARHSVPAADLMARETGLFGTAQVSFRDAFIAAGPDALWRETYKGTDIGQDFMDRFGCYCLIGPGGPWISAQMAGFVVYMPAGLHYPWHHHPAEEMYLVLAGEADFLRACEAPETLRAGETSFHASNQPHAMQTGAHPVMAYVTWRSHLETPPVLTGRSVEGFSHQEGKS